MVDTISTTIPRFHRAHKHEVLKVFADHTESNQVLALISTYSPLVGFFFTLCGSWLLLRLNYWEILYINCVCMTWIRRFTLLKMFQKYPMQWKAEQAIGNEREIEQERERENGNRTQNVKQSVKKRKGFWRSVLNCHVLKFKFVKEKQRQWVSNGVKWDRKRPSSMCIFNDGPFSFLWRFFFSFFLGEKYYNILCKATKVPHIVFDMEHSYAVFFLSSMCIFSFLTLFSFLSSFSAYFIITSRWSCISFVQCSSLWICFVAFFFLQLLLFLSLFGGHNFPFFFLLFITSSCSSSLGRKNISIACIFLYAWPKFYVKCWILNVSVGLFACLATCSIYLRCVDDLVFITVTMRACNVTIHFQ